MSDNEISQPFWDPRLDAAWTHTYDIRGREFRNLAGTWERIEADEWARLEAERKAAREERKATP